MYSPDWRRLAVTHDSLYVRNSFSSAAKNLIFIKMIQDWALTRDSIKAVYQHSTILLLLLALTFCRSYWNSILDMWKFRYFNLVILEDPTVRCSLPTNQLIQSWSILPLVLTLVEKICIHCILTFAFSRKVINVKWTYKKFSVKIMCDRILFKITEELDFSIRMWFEYAIIHIIHAISYI